MQQEQKTTGTAWLILSALSALAPSTLRNTPATELNMNRNWLFLVFLGLISIISKKENPVYFCESDLGSV